MGNDLKLRVLLGAIDKASGPLKVIDKRSTATARALKETRDRLKALNAQQQDISAWRAQRSASLRTEEALNAAREKVRALSQQFAATGAPTRAMTKHFQAAVRAAQALKQQHRKQGEQLQALRARLAGAGISTQHLARDERQLRQQIGATNASLSTQYKRLAALNEQQRRLSTARASLDTSRRSAGELTAKGAVATAGSGSVLYAGARMLSPGINFDASLSQVQAITRLDEHADALKALRTQARELGGATQFTAGQAADAQGYLGMAGFEPNAIRAAMPGMLNLAAAGGTELAQTADIASNILSGLGLTADEMDRLGDVLVGTFTRSNTTLQMLGDTMKYAAPMAKTYGVELEVAAAMAGKLGDAGLQGSMGGTALSSIMNRLAAPPKGAEKALQQLNITTADAVGNLRPLPDLLKEIYSKTHRLGTAEKGGLFKAIAGEEAVKGMAQLVEQAGTGQLQVLIANLRQSQGEAARTAKVMADNLKGDLTSLSSAWQDLGIELQDQQNEPLRELVQSVTALVRSIKSWARENPKLAAGLVKTVAIIAALAVAVGGLMLALASVLLPFAALRFVLVQLGFRLPGLIGLLSTLGRTVLPFVARALLIVGRALMLNPIGLAITAIAGAAYLLYEHWDAVTAYLAGAWREIQTGFDNGLGGILKVLADFSPVGLIYQAFAAVMKYLGIDLPNRFTAFGGLMVDGLVNGLTAGMSRLKEVVDRLGTRTIDAFKETLGIHSPSRVFAELGGFTVEGLVQGLTLHADGPLGAITALGEQLIAAGGRLSSIDSLTVDTRAPISPRPSQHIDSHDTYAIHIHTTPGMDANAVARTVRAEIARHQNEKAARRRSRLSDLE
ncbi:MULTISPECIES: phage tail tape measure protein [Pseudomonas]|uniref:Phage tail tape measure protein domain-containing protein n=1 Tax=Pseudomonas fluorescens TaxID=294 RepID=A0A0N9W6C8_PSEFL|nr:MULTISPECIES: phage tail tape measure protein [Pseudomonas]ALI09104.1 hypothetical protein AO356_20525 [Pseudomonas fluorescens]